MRPRSSPIRVRWARIAALAVLSACSALRARSRQLASYQSSHSAASCSWRSPYFRIASVDYLRAMLGAHGALPPRDEPLARLEGPSRTCWPRFPPGKVIGPLGALGSLLRRSHSGRQAPVSDSPVGPADRPGNRSLPFPTTLSLQLTDVRPSSAAGLLALGVRNAFLAVESSRQERLVALVARSTQCRCLLRRRGVPVPVCSWVLLVTLLVDIADDLRLPAVAAAKTGEIGGRRPP